MHNNKKTFTLLALTVAISAVLAGCNDDKTTTVSSPAVKPGSSLNTNKSSSTASGISTTPAATLGIRTLAAQSPLADVYNTPQPAPMTVAGKDYTATPLYATIISDGDYATRGNHKMHITQNDDSTYDAELDPIIVAKVSDFKQIAYDTTECGNSNGNIGSIGTPVPSDPNTDSNSSSSSERNLCNITGGNNQHAQYTLKGKNITLVASNSEYSIPNDSSKTTLLFALDTMHTNNHSDDDYKNKKIALFGHYLDTDKYYITSYALLNADPDPDTTTNTTTTMPDEVEGIVTAINSVDSDTITFTLDHNFNVTYTNKDTAKWNEVIDQLTIGRHIQAQGTISDGSPFLMQAATLSYTSLSTMTQELDTEGFIAWVDNNEGVIKLDNGTIFLTDDNTVIEYPEPESNPGTIDTEANNSLQTGDNIIINSIYHPAGYRLATKITETDINNAYENKPKHMEFECEAQITKITHYKASTSLVISGCMYSEGDDDSSPIINIPEVTLTDETIYFNNIDHKALSVLDNIYVSGYRTGPSNDYSYFAIVARDETPTKED